VPAKGGGAKPTVQLEKLRNVPARDYLLRFAFGAVISIAAGVIGKTVSPRFGGMFLAFPAILPASLTLIQQEEGTRRADRNAVGAVLGGVGLLAFAAVGEATFGRVEPFLALFLALLAWMATSVGLYALLAFLRPDLCDASRD
jgi:hypothetical protein